MAINIRNVLELLQQKEHEVTSSTSTDDLITLFKASKKGAGAVIRSYDSDGLLPDATTTTERIAFSEAVGELRFNNNGQWDYIVGGAAVVEEPTVLFYQGDTYGYSANGFAPAVVSTIEKYSLVSDANATSVGNTTQARWASCGQSSSTHGYTTQGMTGPWPSPNSNVIDKYPFAVDGNATDVGDLTQARYEMAGQTGPEYGYASGGYSPAGRIEKFPFASDANATDIGSIAAYYGSPAGFSSTTHGYQSGGYPDTAVTHKFTFAVDANSTSVGNLVYTLRGVGGGISSDTSGYVTGGGSPSQRFNYIQKFSLSVDGNATDIADITVARGAVSAASGGTYGYTAGGATPANVNTIDKFPYAADVNATDVGDLTVARSASSGNQY